MLMLGTNDSKERNWDKDKYRDDLESLVREYTSLDSEPSVYLMIPPRVLDTALCKKMSIQREVTIPNFAPSIHHITYFIIFS